MEHVLTAALCKCTQPSRIKWLHGVRGGERERERDALQGDEVRAAETEPSANSHTESELGQTQLRGRTKLRADDDDTNIARGPQEASGGGASGFQYQ